MAISIYSNSGIKNYGIKHFILDTDNDLEKLSVNYTPGSTAQIMESSKYYMLNNQHEWIEINSSFAAPSGGSGGSGVSLDDYDTIIFDGNTSG